MTPPAPASEGAPRVALAFVVVCVLVGLPALNVDLPWLRELFGPTAILDAGEG